MASPSDTQQRLLKSFEQAEPVEYTPAFRVETDRLGYRLMDGERGIGLVGTEGYLFFDVWCFGPEEPIIMMNPDPPGKVVDLHTIHNTTINLPFASCKDLVEGVDDPFSRVKLTWLKAAGTELDLAITAEFEEGQRVEYHFRVTYEASWGRYRWWLEADVWKLSNRYMEPINMMLAGALGSTPERRRWTHSVWADPWGKLKHLVHSNALFSGTDYAHPTGEWRSKNAPLEGAWIAYAAHGTFNPAMVVHHTNTPMYFATCSALFDEHLIWHPAGLDELDGNHFHFKMHTEFVNLSYELAKEFLEAAAAPPVPEKWRCHRTVLPFRLGVTNDFEAELDVWAPEDCPVLVLEKDAEAPVQWVKGTAHSGSHSIRMTGRKHQRFELMPSCAVCDVIPHHRYRFSCWVKTQAVFSGAWIELTTFEYIYANTIDIVQSPKVKGDSDWTLVTVELDAGDEAYVMPILVLHDRGTAWFDDARLEQID